MLRCHNCEVLDCPQEEYPARLLPTPPPSYIDNLQSRLIQARNGIFSASLKMVLNTKCQLLVQRPAPETSVQLDGIIGEHRAGENIPSSECDASPRRAAVDMGSEEPGTPQPSAAISKGPGPGHREPKRKWRKQFSLLKPVWMVICVQISQAWSRSVYCYNQTSGQTTTEFNQKSEWTTTTTPLHNKPPFARIS